MPPFAAAIPEDSEPARHRMEWERAFIQLLRNVDNTTARSNLKTVRRPYLGLVRSNDGRL
jgi:hypothetical protein